MSSPKPILVGVGQHVMRDQTAEDFTPPIEAMATAVRARFHPGEDRSVLASPADEAARILQLL